jgi:hypothetical protein
MLRSRSPMTSSYRRDRDRSYSPYNINNDYEENSENGSRIHVADLSSNCTKREIEKAFEKWPIIEVWHAQASCFAFVVLRHREDGQQAISELDGRYKDLFNEFIQMKFIYLDILVMHEFEFL